MANVAQAKLCVKGYGKNFKALRENAKLTQEQLGEILRYSSKTISNIESEQRLPSNEQLLSYKNHFDVSLDYLTGHTTVTDVEISKMSEYTGLSEKALEQLHEFSSSVHDAYVLGSVLETSNLLFFDTIINQLFENNIFQDIVLYACKLMFESTLLVEGGEQILNDDNTGLNFRFYQSDLECDVQRLKISEILSRLTDFCDERAKQKEKYNSLMKRFNSEKKHNLEGVFSKFNLDKKQQNIFDKYFRASDGNEEGDENG